MGLIGKLREVAGIEEIEEEITEEEIKAAETKLDRQPGAERTPLNAPRQESKPAAPLQSSQPARTVTGTGAFKLVVLEPKTFDECPKLVDNLKARKPVILNLEKLESDVARKIFDFMSGATYALNGNVQKVANNIFVFAPENVDITATVEHKGIEFGTDKSIWR